MVRIAALVSVLLAVVALALSAEDSHAGAKPKVQMVRGTIKIADPAKDLLVLNQKVKAEVVDRELSILDTTEFVVMSGGKKTEATGRDGLRLLEGQAGAAVNVKCDKDVNVLRVTVTLKK